MSIVYVLTNEAFKDGYVKVGRTTNLEQRLRQLDNTSVPLPFRCVFAIQVPNDAEVERLTHIAFGNHRIRTNREFFALHPSHVIAALKMTGGVEVTPKGDIAENEEGIEALQRAVARRSPARLSEAGLRPGDVITYLKDEQVTAKVLSDRKIMFEGEVTSLSASALKLLQREGYQWQQVNGWHYWMFDEETLAERLQSIEAQQAEMDELADAEETGA